MESSRMGTEKVAGNAVLASELVRSEHLDECRENPVWVWLAFVMAEAVVASVGVFLWRKESGKVLAGIKTGKAEIEDEK